MTKKKTEAEEEHSNEITLQHLNTTILETFARMERPMSEITARMGKMLTEEETPDDVKRALYDLSSTMLICLEKFPKIPQAYKHFMLNTHEPPSAVVIILTDYEDSAQ